MESLRQRIELGICGDLNDDTGFMDLAGRAVSGELEDRAVREVFIIRIDNWFDRKWLNFSGKGRVPFRWDTGLSFYNPDTAIDEFRQVKKTFPPFAPDRVIGEYGFVREGDESYSPDRNARLVHRQVRARSSLNLHRRVAAFSESALFVWFSSQTRVNGHGSLLVYRANGSAVTSWYASFSKAVEWKLLQVEGIGRERLRTWLAG
jgi:hypothetical protein